MALGQQIGSGGGQWEERGREGEEGGRIWAGRKWVGGETGDGRIPVALASILPLFLPRHLPYSLHQKNGRQRCKETHWGSGDVNIHCSLPAQDAYVLSGGGWGR